ncbi:MAG: hypothetical protein WCG13_15480 [Burkholderiales bacterium]|jgi:DNA-binding transcriptional MerR regulator
MTLQSFRQFSGNAGALCDTAIECARSLGLAFSEEKAGERVVRYYVAEGVMDRPERLGRDAAYNWRHLLQFLTARRMAEAGIALSVVAQHNAAATTRALEDALVRPLPTAAEILVNGFLGAAGAAGKAAAHRPPGKPPGTTTARPPSASLGRPQFALPDVLDEMRQMTRTVLKRLDTITSEQAALARRQEELLQQQQHLQRQLEHHLARLAATDLRNPITPKGPKR